MRNRIYYLSPWVGWQKAKYIYKLFFHIEKREEQVLWNSMISPEGRITAHIWPETKPEIRAFLDKKILRVEFLKKYGESLSDKREHFDIDMCNLRRILSEYPDVIPILKKLNNPDGLIVENEEEMGTLKLLLEKYDEHNKLKFEIFAPITTDGILYTPRVTRFLKLLRDGLKYYTFENAPYVIGLFVGLKKSSLYANIVFLLASTCRYFIKQSTDEIQVVQDRLANIKANAEAQVTSLIKNKVIAQSASKKVKVSTEFNQITFIVTRVWEEVLAELSKVNKVPVKFEDLPRLKTSEITLNMIAALSHYLCEVRKAGVVEFHYEEAIANAIVQELSDIFVKNLNIKSAIGDIFAKLGLSGIQYVDHVTIQEVTIFNIIEYVCEKNDVNVLVADNTKKIFKDNLGSVIQTLKMGDATPLGQAWNKVYDLDRMGKYNEHKLLEEESRIMEEIAKSISTTALMRSSNMTIRLIQISSDFISYWLCTFINQMLLGKWFQSDAMKAVITVTGFKLLDATIKNFISRYEIKLINDHKIRNEAYTEFNANLIEIFKKRYFQPGAKQRPPKQTEASFVKRFKTFNYIIAKTVAKTLQAKNININEIAPQDLSIIGICLFNVLSVFMRKECEGKAYYNIAKEGIDNIVDGFASILVRNLKNYGTQQYELDMSVAKLIEDLKFPLEPCLESYKQTSQQIKERVRQKSIGIENELFSNPNTKTSTSRTSAFRSLHTQGSGNLTPPPSPRDSNQQPPSPRGNQPPSPRGNQPPSPRGNQPPSPRGGVLLEPNSPRGSEGASPGVLRRAMQRKNSIVNLVGKEELNEVAKEVFEERAQETPALRKYIEPKGQPNKPGHPLL